MDKATQTMIDNLFINTGKSLEQWIEIVNSENFAKHGEIIKFLKEGFGLSYGFANLIAHKAKGSDAGSVENQDELITKQYVGKEHFIPVYQKLMTEIEKFGNDIEIAPKNAYVSLRRKKQFALLQPATKTRFEIGIILKGQESKGTLEKINTANAMCSHKINVAGVNEIDGEVIDWLKKAYENAG
jgi:predicted transport protein